MTTSEYFVGLMSGTSVDAVDAVVARFVAAPLRAEIIATHSAAPPPALREQLLALNMADSRLSLREFGHLDQEVGIWFADAANAAIEAAGLSPRRIAAIGSHGQTIWHAPEDDLPFSLQIGSASRIAARTGCIVISDFRNADIAVGGQGAPLACAFHAAFLGDPTAHRAVVNIGGISNVTLLPASPQPDPSAIRGFDTGPGNALMDAWIKRCLDRDYDAGGSWAASGHIHDKLLETMLAEDYFHRAPPKSTGREHFGLDWLAHQLAALEHPPSPADVQATLCELTATVITAAIEQFEPGTQTIHLCGGGVHNQHLVNRIAARANSRPVESTQALGLDPDWIEALTFAWLARQRQLNQPGNAPGVTGASHLAVLGGCHQPPRVT